jgi:hypothetical protein
MARQKLDILVVRNDGPVQPMRFGPWVLYLFVILLCLTLLGLGGAGYLLFEQHLALERLTKDTKRLRLSTQSLEALLSQGQGWSRLSQPRPSQPRQPQPVPKPRAKTTTSTVAKLTTSSSTTSTSTTLPPAPPSPVLAPAASPPAGQNGAVPEQGAQSQPSASVSQGLELEPDSSDWVAIRNVRQRKSGGRLTIRFQVANKKEGQGQAEGYVTVVLRGIRKGSPWLEAWPPTRLSPLGRPENYKRGKPFAVKRYRTLKARFAVADKYLEQLEFVIYDRQGNLVMMRKVDITIKQKSRPN